MKTIVHAHQVCKSFGVPGGQRYTALDHIDLEIKEGEFVGVMGPSGAGKSTLLNILSTIDTPTSGDVVIADEHIANLSDRMLADFRRNQLGFIFQDYNLLDPLTVRENIVLPLALSHVPVREIEQRVNHIAHAFGIADILDKYPYHISGGQKQRTAASRAMISNPSLILADEPTGALDSKSAASLLESLSALNQRTQATIMMVTHDAFAASYCSRVIFINDGRLFQEIHKDSHSRAQFYQIILDILASLGGNRIDSI